MHLRRFYKTDDYINKFFLTFGRFWLTFESKNWKKNCSWYKRLLFESFFFILYHYWIFKISPTRQIICRKITRHILNLILRYFIDNRPTLVLSRAYCYSEPPMDDDFPWLKMDQQKIHAISKDKHYFRSWTLHQLSELIWPI